MDITKRPIGSWFRRVVPESYARASLHLEGTSPILMNCPDLDRESELYRAFITLSQKKGKTLEDEARLRELEWKVRIYLDDEVGPYVPGSAVKKCLMVAATKWRMGETLHRSLVTVGYRIPLLYDGPRDEQGLWDGGYRYTTMVQNAGFGSGRVMRCRPMFPEWSLDTELAYDPEEIDSDKLKLIVERAQRFGLLDYRPEFGSFIATVTVGEIKTTPVKASAVKNRNGHEQKGHDAMKARIMDPKDLVTA